MTSDPEIFALPPEEAPEQLLFDDWALTGDDLAHTSFLYEFCIRHMSLPALAHRPDGEIVFLNRAAVSLVNRSNDKAVGSHIQDLFGQAWFAMQQRHIAETTVAQPEFDTQLRFKLEDGFRLFDIESTVFYTSRGDQGLVWLVMRDVTVEQQAKERLEIANQKLNDSNRDLEEFAYVASHDLQEPLRKIQTFGDRLRARLEADDGAEIDEKSLDYLERMDNASQRMQTLIQDLLSFSRISTTGRGFEPISLQYVVKTVLNDLEVAVSDANATVHVGQLPTLDADEPQLRQLMQNLIGNALKFRQPDRDPEIWIEAVIIGPRWLLSVRDNGIGFEQSYAEKIFTVFQRLHGRSAYSGTGVGLAICRKIAERHGGTIRAEGVPGEGATFLIDLPRSVGETASAA